MGLDMYLTARKSLYSDNEKAQAVTDVFPEFQGMTSAFGEPVVTSVSAEIGYWRKANAIHRWFVENVQGGEDDCRSSYVDRKYLHDLKDACVAVLNNPQSAGVLLPTASGFFFGGTELDEYYMDSIRSTIDIIDRCLGLPDDWDFYYQSSW